MLAFQLFTEAKAEPERRESMRDGLCVPYDASFVEAWM